MPEPPLAPWLDDAHIDAVERILQNRSRPGQPGRLLDVGPAPLPPERRPAGYTYAHLATCDDLAAIEPAAAAAVALRFVLADRDEESRVDAVASAWKALRPQGTLVLVDDLNPVSSLEIDWSADVLVRLILDVSAGAATLADAVVLRRSEDDEARYGCVAVTPL